MTKLVAPITERDHVLGELDARVALLEYGDYECPFCGRAYPILKEVLRRAGSAVCFVFRNFPLSEVHPHALIAAQAAEAAAAEGMFWPMHDALYENQHALELDDILGYAAVLSLDVERMRAEIEGGVYRERVRQDFRSGVRSGVNGTPAFYIDGYRFDGAWDAETLTAALEIAGRDKYAFGAARP
jgi:protein-disulfide isomerase